MLTMGCPARPFTTRRGPGKPTAADGCFRHINCYMRAPPPPCTPWQPVNTAANRSNTDLLRPAHRQGVVVIRLLGVVIRAHFVDIESHIVPLFVSSRPARQRAQDHDAVQAHCLLPAALSVSSSQRHVPGGGWRMKAISARAATYTRFILKN